MVFDWETSLILFDDTICVEINLCIYALNLSESWYIIVGHSMMFMSHFMLLCENPAGHPDWQTGTGSKPAASSKLCWGARVEMHSKEPCDGSFESFYVFCCMCRAPTCAYDSQPFPPLLATRCCEQNSRTCGLWFQPCLYDTVLLGPCRTMGPMSLRFFPDSNQVCNLLSLQMDRSCQSKGLL